MTRGTLPSSNPKLLNKVVDEVIEAEICEVQSAKGRKTMIFKCELALAPAKPKISNAEALEEPSMDEVTGGVFDVNNYFS